VAGLEAGGDVYITKPVEFPVLKAHVEAAFRRASATMAPAPRALQTKRTRLEQYVFPELLKSKLAGIQNYPLTLVEAPSGFGKTTAVREYLRGNLPEGAREKWYTCLGEPSGVAWAGICRLFNEIGADIALRLSKLFPLTKESLPDIAAAMLGCRCENETFLVIDNYQLFENELPHDIINAFSVHGAEKLHIVVITQPLSIHGENVRNDNINKLETKDFLFSRENTARFCRLSGTRLSDGELEKVQSFSEGWIAAIRLQVESYKKTSFVSNADSFDELIEMAIWNRMPDEDRDSLIGLSLLDGFTEKQAAIMIGNPERQSPSKGLARLLKGNFFIPYVADKGVYSMHSLLRDYLLKRFDAKPSSFAETMHQRAGVACAAVSDYFQAARFFMRNKDFDAILSMPLTPRYLNELEAKDVFGFFEHFVEECPKDTLQKYPFAMLALAFQFMKGGNRELFSLMIRLLNDLCGREHSDLKSHDLSEVKLSRVKGEVALLMSFTTFNDIAKMSAYHKEALAHLSGGGEPSSTVILGRTPWTFGITSVLCLFWSGAGRLDKECELMDECLPIYSRITNGHGAGADSVFRAEAHLMRGNDVEAETACHKAIHQAGDNHQMSIRLCAELVLARIAILRGDAGAYAEYRAAVERNATGSHLKAVSRMGELCFALLDMTLGGTKDLPEWLRDADAVRRVFFAQGHPYVLTLHCMMLLLEGRHAELYGLTELISNTSRGLNYLLPQVYQHIFCAVAKKKDGVLAEAAEHLRAALDIALPDMVCLPFAEFGADLLPLLKTEAKNYDAEKMLLLLAICRRQMAGVADLVRQAAGKKSPLTSRERDIALLAKERLSAREIATRLFISENTVNSALKNIYQKLEIHTKGELAKKDF
jgi:LuxR family maltose regulon positive regulatory protein